MEATGHYWLSLYSFLLEKDLSIHVINPIQTDGWRNGIEIRKRKTDIIDSILIADLLRYGNFVETSLAPEDYFSLKFLTRFRSYLVSSIGDLKRKTIAVLDQVLPEYTDSFTDIFGTTSKKILNSLSTPEEFDKITSNDLNEILKEIRLKKFAIKKIDELSEKAKKLFGIKFAINSFSIQIKHLINQIDFIESQISDIEGEIGLLMKKINSPITSIPGVGPITGATILGEIGDISKFSDPSKLVAYSGLAAIVSQFGEYKSSSTRISKRGSSALRKALLQAALRAEFYDPVFSNYYKSKIVQGKHHSVATNAVARKLCHTIFAALTKNECYKIQN